MAAGRTPAQVGRYSREKGARFERQIAKEMSAWLGSDVQRTPGSGAYGSRWKDLCGDLMFAEDVGLYCELKCREGWTLEQLFSGEQPAGQVWDWFVDTCKRAEDQDLSPMLIFTRNRQPVYVALRAHHHRLRIQGDFSRFVGVSDPDCPYWADIFLWSELQQLDPERLWSRD